MLNRRSFVVAAAASSLVVPVGFAAPGKVRDLYNKDLSFSDFATTNVGERLEIDGFMAPPLKAESDFFVLTRRPMSVCPFCETEADWPGDIVAVYTKYVVTVFPFNIPIRVSGVLELGTYRDEELGFVSLMRLVDAEIWTI